MVATPSSAIDRRPLPADGFGMSGASPDSVDLAGMFALIARRWWIVLLAVVLFVGAGFAYASLAQKVYTATTRVLLDPRDKQIAGTDLTTPSQGPQAGWIETQVDLVTAFATLKKVVVAERLVDDPEFGGTGSASDVDAVVRSFAEHVRAERTADTYVIDVIVSSTVPDKAARLSIAVAQAFVDSSTEGKQNAARQANDLLRRQLDDLRARARAADERVQQYRQQNGLVQSDGQPIDEQTLAQLNTANIEARLKADQSEERWRKIDSLARSGSAEFGASLDGVDSAVLGRLKVEYAIVQKDQAQLADTLGSRHPKMAALDAEVQRTRGLIQQELQSLATKAKLDADLARAQAGATAAALADATRLVNDSGQAGVELKELEGEAAMRRDVYRTFGARAEETGLQENLQVSDVRLISPAQVPLRPSEPRRTIILALALIGGLGTGISLALYMGRPAARPEPPEPDEAAALPADEGPALVPRLAGGEVLAELPMPAPLAGGAPLHAGEAAARMADFAEGAGAAIDALAARLIAPGETEGPAVLVVFGTAAEGAIAALALALAEAVARDGTETLLVDASQGATNITAALLGPDSAGILDVEIGAADADEIGTRLAGTSVVLLPAAGASLRHRIQGHGETLVETIEDVAAGFGRIVVDLGPACPPALFAALADIADDVLMVVDAAEADRPDIVAMFEELHDLVPALGGMVAIRPVPVAVASDRLVKARP